MCRKALIPLSAFLMGLIVIIIAVSYIGQNFEVNSVLIKGLPVKNYNFEWVRTDNGFKGAVVTLSEVLQTDDSGKITLKKKLPSVIESEQVICLETEQQSLKAWINGELVYEQKVNTGVPFGNTLGSIWNIITIKPSDAGKEITLEFQSHLKSARARLYGMSIGRESAILYTLVIQHMPVVCITLIAIIQGCICIIVGLVSITKKYKNTHQSFLYLGAFSIMAGIWMITDTKILQFFTSNHAVTYLTSFFTFDLMPAPFMLYMSEICPRYSQFFRKFSLAFSLVFFFNFTMYIFGWINLMYTVVFTHALILFAIPPTMLKCFKESRLYKNKIASQVFWGLCILCIMSAISIPWFYFKRVNDNTSFFRYGILFFILFLVIGAFKKELSIIHENTKVQTYKRLAYLDTMTMISNRVAFDQELDLLQKEYRKYTTISVMVFDINNLKDINDTYGHSAGDDLIIGFARCLDMVFKHPCQAYRIGGDEFAVISKSWSEWDIEQASIRLKEYVDSYNENCKNKIYYAWGYSYQVIRRTGDLNLYTLLNAADKKMYTMKRAMRGKT